MRLFTAISIPENIGAYYAPLKTDHLLGRWNNTDDFHITLNFIGDVTAQEVLQIEQNLGHVIQNRFDLNLTDIQLFSHSSGKGADVLHIGVDMSADLQMLKQNVDDAIVKAGLSLESRPYQPHMTLAFLETENRAGDIAEYRQMQNKSLKPQVLPVTAFGLYCSDENAGQSRYKILRSYALRDNS